MAKSEQESFWRLSNPIAWGIAATLLVILFVLSVASVPTCKEHFFKPAECVSKFNYLFQSSPNEVGDALAGFAGALAFVWIIVTVALQSKELAAQREELRLTRLEFAKISESQERQVELLLVQGAIFEDEKNYRSEIRAKEQFDNALPWLMRRMRTLANETVYDARKEGKIVRTPIFCGSTFEESDFSDFSFGDLCREIYATGQLFVRSEPEIGKSYKKAIKEKTAAIIPSIKDLVSLENNLSLADQARLEELRLKDALIIIEKVHNICSRSSSFR